MSYALLCDLQEAQADNQFRLVFQPIVALATDQIEACEALLRWEHPQLGTLLPDAYIPLLESSGLIVPVSAWVLKEACAEATTWPDNVRVAVNVSGVQFKTPGLTDHVAAALAGSGLPARRLELELTETALLDGNNEVTAALRALHAMGVRLVLDDFGAGYSTLSYLRSFPFEKIKIDRSFTQGLCGHDDNTCTIMRAVARLGTTLGIETTAEGIETHAQLDLVRAKGCTSAQGFLLHRPMPATDLRALLSSGRAAPSESCGERTGQPVDTQEEDRLDALHQYCIVDTPPEESFDRITRLAQVLMQAPVAMISFVDRERQWFKSRHGTDRCESERGISFCTHTIQKNEPLIVRDALRDPRFSTSPLVTGPDGVRSYIGVPLQTPDGHRIGALCVNDVVPRDVTPQQIECLQDLAKLVIDELELRRLATVDSLTGAATPRMFILQGRMAFNQARRYERALSCIVMDVDHFKSINDTYGHAAGDKVLMEMGKLCKSLLRSADTFGRLGGEEFGILLPEADANAAAKVAEMLRDAVGRLRIRHLDQEILLTASFGVTGLGAQDRSFAAVLARADAALYAAKSAGRDTVVARDATTEPEESMRLGKTG